MFHRIANLPLNPGCKKASERYFRDWSEDHLYVCKGNDDQTDSPRRSKISMRKLNRQRSVYPSDTALLKALYLATFEATKKWTSTVIIYRRKRAWCSGYYTLFNHHRRILFTDFFHSRVSSLSTVWRLFSEFYGGRFMPSPVSFTAFSSWIIQVAHQFLFLLKVPYTVHRHFCPPL